MQVIIIIFTPTGTTDVLWKATYKCDVFLIFGSRVANTLFQGLSVLCWDKFSHPTMTDSLSQISFYVPKFQRWGSVMKIPCKELSFVSYLQLS
jgi:hypothetical protein